ncbi:histone-like nucleoid-structuring protein Lsr2 [Corynebacterium sp. 335C]
MGRKEIIQYFDDMTGESLADDAVETIRFSYRGRNYVIDLSKGNAEKFDEALKPFIDAARVDAQAPAKAPQRKSRGADEATRNRNRIIRQWAKDQGLDVADRGALSKDIIAKYEAAH